MHIKYMEWEIINRFILSATVSCFTVNELPTIMKL